MTTCMLSHVQLVVTPWTVAHQAHLSMEFYQQEYWSVLPFPTPRDLSNLGIEPESLDSRALAGRFFTTALPGKLQATTSEMKFLLRTLREEHILGNDLSQQTHLRVRKI